MPSPFWPGLQAISYTPVPSDTVRSYDVPGPMFSFSVTILVNAPSPAGA
jgi:hypothetical protein